MNTLEKVLTELQKNSELRQYDDSTFYLVDINAKWSKLPKFNFEAVKPYLRQLPDDGTSATRYGAGKVVSL